MYVLFALIRETRLIWMFGVHEWDGEDVHVFVEFGNQGRRISFIDETSIMIIYYLAHDGSPALFWKGILISVGWRVEDPCPLADAL